MVVESADVGDAPVRSVDRLCSSLENTTVANAVVEDRVVMEGIVLALLAVLVVVIGENLGPSSTVSMRPTTSLVEIAEERLGEVEVVVNMVVQG